MFLAIGAVRIAVAAIAALSTLKLGAGIYFWRVTEALERPSYKVIEKLTNGVEIRRYDSYLIAETTVDGVGFREPTKAGFRACASYIFGKNKRANTRSTISSWFSTTADDVAEKMVMTAPVRVSGEAPPSLSKGKSTTTSTMKKTKVSFVIGSKYSLITAPKPLDRSVKVRQVSPHTLAVRTLSGPPPKDDRVKKERAKIEKSLTAAGMTIPGGPDAETLVYGYHDPFITPSFLRRNEVAVVIDGTA
jgi:SOUL heme-binding protein